MSYTSLFASSIRLEYPGLYFNTSGFPIPCIAPFLFISTIRPLIFRNILLSCVCQYK